MTIQGWLNGISPHALFGNDKPKPTERPTPRHPSPRPRYKPQPDTPPTSLLDFVSRTRPQQGQVPKEERTRHEKVIDSHFGFVPLSRRLEFDIEACRILGKALKAGGLMEGEALPRVWTEPTKAQLREIGRMGRTQGGRQCVRLVAAPRVTMAEGMKMWEELDGFFWVPEGERVALEKARGRWCFTEVPVELLVDLEMRKGLIRRVRNNGDLEQDGQIVLERMGERRKPYGAVVARMPVIREAEDGAGGDLVEDVVDSGGNVNEEVEGDREVVGEVTGEWTDIGTDEGMSGRIGGGPGGTASGHGRAEDTQGSVQRVMSEATADRSPSLFTFFRRMRVRHFNQ